MHEPTIAELRTFLAVIEHGSFSSAARKLGRVQSAVSQTIATLEEGLGVKLFDRGTKRPTPTDAARVLAVSAHKVLSEVGALAERAASFSRGTEAVVSLCVDALFPLGHLVRACAAFAAEFPEVELRVATEALSAVTSRVL
ncbi:MAG: LysR family transcriptional regulator, partial [Myxococcales bacterium]|nr:LysR family transcriptional regulator [Myxococcales bacterium]